MSACRGGTARGGVLGSLLIVMAGCSGPRAYVRPHFLDHPPARVAVLPFVITYPYDLGTDAAIPSSHRIGRDTLRKTFYYALTPYGYEDVPLTEVDAQLAAAWGPIEQGRWQHVSPRALGEALGADALIYGELQHLMHFATPLYTQTSLEASLRMVEVASGDVLWRIKTQATERGGALMQKGQVVDFLKDQARSFHPEVKFLRISESAVRRALKGLPNPPLATAAVSSPRARHDEGRLRLAILPFEAARTGWRKPAVLLRASLTSHLQDGPFEVIELNRVDAALEASGWRQGTPLPDAAALSGLAEAVGADALMQGRVTSWGRNYFVLASSVKAGLALQLLDGSSGVAVWSQQKRNSRQAGLLKGPTGYQSLVTAPVMGLKSSHLERVAGHLTRELADDLNASPAVLAYVSERKP